MLNIYINEKTVHQIDISLDNCDVVNVDGNFNIYGFTHPHHCAATGSVIPTIENDRHVWGSSAKPSAAGVLDTPIESLSEDNLKLLAELRAKADLKPTTIVPIVAHKSSVKIITDYDVYSDVGIIKVISCLVLRESIYKDKIVTLGTPLVQVQCNLIRLLEYIEVLDD